MSQAGRDRGGAFFGRKLGEPTDPREQEFLFVASLLDPLAAGVSLTVGRLLVEKRTLGILRIDELGQSEPERRDLVARRILTRELEPRRRRHPLLPVAQPALRLIEDRVDLFGEE